MIVVWLRPARGSMSVKYEYEYFEVEVVRERRKKREYAREISMV